MLAAPVQADDLAARAANLRTLHDDAHAGRAVAYRLAHAGLDACERALLLPAPAERNSACLEAQRRVDACEAAHEQWLQALEQFTVDALAVGRSEAHAELIKSDLPDCPSTLPRRGIAPGAALVGASRAERQALPHYPVCESYLRALLSAADAGQASLVEGLARDLVAQCGAEHPDYRRQAEAGLIRVGLDPALLDRPRPVQPPASAP